MHPFSLLEGEWSVARLGARDPIPAWALDPSPLTSITRTRDELSIVCPAASVPVGVVHEGGWSVLALHGPFPFTQVGVLASFASPLAAAGISLFAMATYDTDYILVHAEDASAACEALVAAGHQLVASARAV